MQPYSEEDRRLEYQMVSEHYKQAVTYRFTLLGILAAAVAFLLGKEGGVALCVCGAGMVIGIWIIELRNRTMLMAFAKRMIEVERSWDNEKDPKQQNKHFMTYYHGHDFDLAGTAVLVKNREWYRSKKLSFWQRFWKMRWRGGQDHSATSFGECTSWLFVRNNQLNRRFSHTFGIDVLLTFLLLACVLRAGVFWRERSFWFGSATSEQGQRLQVEPLKVERLRVDPLKVDRLKVDPLRVQPQGMKPGAR